MRLFHAVALVATALFTFGSQSLANAGGESDARLAVIGEQMGMRASLDPLNKFSEFDESLGVFLTPESALSSGPLAATSAAVTSDSAIARTRLQTTGILIVPESTNAAVMAFEPFSGALIDPFFIPPDPTNIGTPINAILGPTGFTILVSDQINDAVLEYDLNGNFLRLFAPAGGVDTSVLDNVRGIDLRENGNLVVTVGGGVNANQIAEFDTDGNFLGNFADNSGGEMLSPFDVHRRTVDYLVGGINSDNIVRYDLATGALISPEFTVIDNFPEQIRAIPNGNVLVGNFSGTEEGVVEYASDGSFIGRYDPAVLGGHRGAWQLGNGNILTTNGSGVHEIDRLGNLIQTERAGVSARFIELALVDFGFACDADPVSFESGAPALGWSVVDNEGTGVVWTNIASSEGSNWTGGAGDCASVSSDAFGPAEYDTELWTPVFDIPSNALAASVEYLANFQTPSNLEFLDLDISDDGGINWTTLLSWNENHGDFRLASGEAVSVDLSAYIGDVNLVLRWHYYNPNAGDDDFYAQIDDVQIVCDVRVADLTVTKTDGQATVRPGDPLTYTVEVSNAGPDDALGLLLEDFFPASYMGAAWTAVTAGGASISETSGAGDIVEFADIPSGGSVTITVDGTVSTAAVGTLSNTAAISGPVDDPNSADNSATDLTDIILPDLVLSKTSSVSSPEFTLPGEEFTFTISVSNVGSSEATGVEVIDPFELEVIYLGDTCGAGLVSGEWVWSIGTLAVGESVTCEITATTASCTVFTNTATVTLNETDQNPGDNSDTLVINEPLNIIADSSFEAGALGGVWNEFSTNFGSPICSVGLCGTGAGTVGPHTGSFWSWFGGISAMETGIVSQEVFLPPNSEAALKFYVWNGISGGAGSDEFHVDVDGVEQFLIFENNPAYISGYVPVVLDLSAFTDGASHEISLESTIFGPGVTNFSVDDVTLTVCPEADLSLAISDSADPAIGGDLLTYTVTVTNSGTVRAVAVNLEDTLPAGISVESVVLSQGTSQTAGGIVTCVLGTVGAGDSASVEINVRPHLTTTGIVTNSATVSTQTAESNSGNNSASEDTTIAQVLISAVPAPTDFGQADIDDGPSASMAITITNDGTQLLSFSGSEVEITGADSSEFQIASDTGENPLGPGTDRIVQVRFDPDSLGDKTAALTITSDARNAPSLEVPLMGIGEQFGPTGRSTRDIVGHILGIVTGPLAEFDVNMDGVVDAGDVVANIEAINAGP